MRPKDKRGSKDASKRNLGTTSTSQRFDVRGLPTPPVPVTVVVSSPVDEFDDELDKIEAAALDSEVAQADGASCLPGSTAGDSGGSSGAAASGSGSRTRNMSEFFAGNSSGGAGANDPVEASAQEDGGDLFGAPGLLAVCLLLPPLLPSLSSASASASAVALHLGPRSPVSPLTPACFCRTPETDDLQFSERILPKEAFDTARFVHTTPQPHTLRTTAVSPVYSSRIWGLVGFR